MAKLTLTTVRGKLAAVTSNGTAVLQGTPQFVTSKYGIYLTFPEVNQDVLTKKEDGKRIYREYKITGASCPVFEQVRKSGDLEAGTWHINAKDIRIR